MTDGAHFGTPVHSLAALTSYGREHHHAVPIEDADTVDALFLRDSFHDRVRGIAIVSEHGMPGRARDATRELIGSHHHRYQELLFLVTHIDQSRNDRNDNHDYSQ